MSLDERDWHISLGLCGRIEVGRRMITMHLPKFGDFFILSLVSTVFLHYIYIRMISRFENDAVGEGLVRHCFFIWRFCEVASCGVVRTMSM